MATVIREPFVDLSIVSGITTIQNTEQRILVVGQKTSAGSATSGALVTDIQNDNSWDTLFGASSQLANMCRNVRRYNTKTRMDAISLSDNGSGTAAQYTVTFTGTATEGGELSVSMGSPDHTYTLVVTSGDTVSTLATNLAALITADTKVPYTAAAALGVMTATFVHKGNAGDASGVAVSGTVAGVSYAVAQSVAGAGDPTLTTLFDVIDDMRYQTIVWPWTADISTVKNFLDARFNVSNIVLDGVAVMTLVDTYANISSAVSALNSQSLCVIANELVSASTQYGGAILEYPWAIAAQVAGIRGLRLTDGSNISRFVISRDGSLDRFGGMAIASLPYFNTPVPDLPLMGVSYGFTADEVDDLQDDGASNIGNNSGGTEVIMGEMVTTYKTDAASNPDVTFKNLEYVDTSSVIREFYFNNLRARFSQHRLTEGSLIAGRAMANGALIEAYCTELYQRLANLALVQEGEAALRYYKQNLVVTLDLATGTATITQKMPIVTQLRRIIGTIEISFTTEG